MVWERRFAAIGAALFWCLVTFTIETAADEVGYAAFVRKLLRDGLHAVFDPSYSNVVFSGAWLFTGATLALWVDYGIKRHVKKRVESASIVFRMGEGFSAAAEPLENIYDWTYFRQVGLQIFLVFDSPIQSALISVFTTTAGIEWKEVQLSDRSAIVEVVGKLNNEMLYITFIAQSKTGRRQQQNNVTQEAVVVPVDVFLSLTERNADPTIIGKTKVNVLDWLKRLWH